MDGDYEKLIWGWFGSNGLTGPIPLKPTQSYSDTIILENSKTCYAIGFGNVSVPLFLFEVAPVKFKGFIVIINQAFIAIGILIADAVLANNGSSELHPFGWRVALGIIGIPALGLLLGGNGIVSTDTPSSLIECSEELAAFASIENKSEDS
ncbi:hypothetical protein ACFE04_025988 [Oxalis oulophora]